MSRRRARDVSFKYIYSKFYGDATEENTLYTILNLENEESVLEDLEKKYLNETIKGVFDNIDFIDNKILSKLKNWTKERIFKVDLAILRLAVYEILFTCDLPYKVAVNEAVELAKKYGNDDSSNFVNGVLREIIKDREEG